jgi:hypothetical protein
MQYSGHGKKQEFHVLQQFPADAKWEDLPTFELVPTPLNATLGDGEIIYTYLTAALFRVDEKGNGAPLMTDKGLINNDNPWFLSYTYQDLKTFWPEFRWLKSCTYPSQVLPEGDPIKVNINDLRERHTKVYATRMDNGFLKGYCGQIYFEWLIHDHNNDTMSRNRDHMTISK